MTNKHSTMAKRRAGRANAESPVPLGHRANKEETLYPPPVVCRHGCDTRRADGRGQGARGGMKHAPSKRPDRRGGSLFPENRNPGKRPALNASAGLNQGDSRYPRAVVGSIIELISVIVLAGNPLSSACFLIASSSSAR